MRVSAPRRFLAGSILNAAAQNLAMLIVGRILLGFGIGAANQVRHCEGPGGGPASWRGGGAGKGGAERRPPTLLCTPCPVPPPVLQSVPLYLSEMAPSKYRGWAAWHGGAGLHCMWGWRLPLTAAASLAAVFRPHPFPLPFFCFPEP